VNCRGQKECALDSNRTRPEKTRGIIQRRKKKRENGAREREREASKGGRALALFYIELGSVMKRATTTTEKEKRRGSERLADLD
jgi:hypothetical protein